MFSFSKLKYACANPFGMNRPKAFSFDKTILKDFPNVFELLLKSITTSKILPFKTFTYFDCLFLL